MEEPSALHELYHCHEETSAKTFAYDLEKAIGLATYEAKRDSAFGIHAVVSVEQADGTIRQVWS